MTTHRKCHTVGHGEDRDGAWSRELALGTGIDPVPLVSRPVRRARLARRGGRRVHVEVAFYGDLFRKDPERGYDPSFDIKEMLADVSGLLRVHEQDVDLDELVKMLVDQHLDRLLAQAGAYLEDDRIRQQARARLEAVIGPETEVVVADSLGTVVAYETLCSHPEWSVTGLVTMGSPLGGEMILGLLGLPPSTAAVGSRKVSHGRSTSAMRTTRRASAPCRRCSTAR